MLLSMYKVVTSDRLMNYALWLLGRRQYTEFQITKKITDKFKPDPELVKKIIDRLKELRYLDDADFVKSWLNYRTQSSPRGRFKLQYELKQKGIGKDLLQKVIQDTEFDETMACKDAARRKLKLLKKSLTRQQRQQKLGLFLTARGFAWDTIKQALAELD